MEAAANCFQDFIHVMVNQKMEFVELTDTDVNKFINTGKLKVICYNKLKPNCWTNHCKFTVAQQFNVVSDKEFTPRIYDHLGAEILNAKMFERVVLKYSNDGAFYLKVDFIANGQNIIAPITPEVISFSLYYMFCIKFISTIDRFEVMCNFLKTSFIWNRWSENIW